MTTDQNSGRREFYAAVALTDLPMPERVSFEPGHVRLVFDTIAACTAWAQAFGVELVTWQDADRTGHVHGYGDFVGRRVCLMGRDLPPVSEPALTGATRVRLEALTTEVA
ncbi:hypothetical protein RB614_37520 [Phytohabitans sp. ZYX-F-186]|uniref:Uncharacterized protein n=1 Tax=Phytohabitans maris TaxID=3071409 RepID=A0ABU0ZT48_9ACTN|nr:hypothetical protein [Phytohabitans sp. ZYX-F-186]MDQ7910211.1 hypothetical protein [Phytohabitans sp. ZYX-F-186]